MQHIAAAGSQSRISFPLKLSNLIFTTFSGIFRGFFIVGNGFFASGE